MKGFLSGLLAAAGLAVGGSAQAAPQVVVGAGTRWVELLPNPEQWEFVRANADGFYVNFIGMDHAPQVKFKDLGKIMAHKVAFLESDMRDATAAADERSLLMLQIAGFTVPYTSLNYGWSRERSNNLKTFALPPGQPRRLCMVQEGPWTLGGNLMGSAPDNVEKRAFIDQDDGDSTDGVMGFWQADTKGMREGSYSMVKYAHARGKKSLVMVTPYAAKIPTYDPDKDFLMVAQQCVRQHENAGATPDYWSVFEYATNYPLVPETGRDGKPANTLTGMAYWLIHHLRDPKGWAHLDYVPAPGEAAMPGQAPELRTPAGGTRTLAFRIRNESDWLDLCPLVRVSAEGAAAVRCTLGGREVPADGVACVGERRLWPQTSRELLVTVTTGTAPVHLHVELLPHPAADPDDIRQRLDLRLLPSALARK